MSLALDGLLAAMLLAAALWTLAAPSAFGAVIGFLVTGLIATLAWVRLDAPDVALTEAALGAGATAVLLLYVATRLHPRTAPARPAPAAPVALRLAAALLAAAVGGLLALAVLTLPDPAPGLAVAAREATAPLGLGNPVAAVLMAHRALDTLLESVVLVFAVLAVWSMAPDRRWRRAPGPAFAVEPNGPLALIARLLPPIGIVIGVYIAWVGAEAPGGKFQGGTILAAMWVLPWIAGLAVPPRVTDIRLRLAIAAGPIVFLAVGLAGMATGGGFLAYPPGLEKPLILAIEAAMTLSVAAALACLIAGPPERRGA
ncbi:MAG: DUF4040 domain-containing protein [Rubritepida sp.]|nr:DUF4040 domain-containing protein [Rubritepida sp.]MCU0944610.1 DUF4040 domain-containing protein [Rubritepida sp.]